MPLRPSEGPIPAEAAAAGCRFFEHYLERRYPGTRWRVTYNDNPSREHAEEEDAE